MRWDKFRRSDNVEDYRDPMKPVKACIVAGLSLLEMIWLTSSKLAKDAGADDVKRRG